MAEKKSQHSENTLSGVDLPLVVKQDLFDDGALDPVYHAKTHVLNMAMQEIGMGRYQWALFVVSGFGWFSDSVWPLLTGLILSPVVSEFKFKQPFLSLAANIGLLVGAILWSFGCDIWGRRWSFNLTLFVASIFGIASGGSADFTTLATLTAILSVGVGGNMPVDSAVFLDFIPASHQYLLVVLSIWWAVGQLLGSLVAWPLIANFSCPLTSDGPCTRENNMGWRYLVFTLGGLMLLLAILRIAVFRLYESPRFLIGRGQNAEAVRVVQAIAKYNRMQCSLKVEDFEEIERTVGQQESSRRWRVLSEGSTWRFEHVHALFTTPKMAWSTTLLISIWGLIGLASTLYNNFLPFLLASRGAQFDDATYYTTYRNQVLLSVTGIPGALLAGYAVERPYFGRRGALALSAGEYPVSDMDDIAQRPRLTGAFLYASTTARSSNALLGWNVGYAFFSNIMYGVLYAVSPEIFPAKDRGTGNGLTATATRVFGVLAPIIALYANLDTAVPVYVSGALIFGAGALALLLPFEPRGKASM
ncbi:MFS general substrate transporter [Vararia minispora EC-137]|uniref:MFS general substrate transporter n=1 Tax=Vararia minispora EC-137 TaxID=1314806 RepID=A0ACB8QUT6_9AGAM|nr:MFS general substrate transporter [Vararia minispora EC-137]